MGKRTNNPIIFLFIFMILIPAAIGIYVYVKWKQTVETLTHPWTVFLGYNTTIGGAAELTAYDSNENTYSIDASYVCELNGNCTYTFTAPEIVKALKYKFTIWSDQVLDKYTVKFVLDATNFTDWDKIQADGSNIYFTDGLGNPVYFWIEKVDLTNKILIAWIKATDLAAAGNIYYMYIVTNGDNPYSSYNDPWHLFEYYNDFSSAPAISCTDTNNDGFAETCSFGVVFEPLSSYVVEMRYKVASYRATSSYSVTTNYASQTYVTLFKTTADPDFASELPAIAVSGGQFYKISAGTWHIIKFVRLGTSLSLYVDGVLASIATTSYTDPDTGIYIRIYDGGGAAGSVTYDSANKVIVVNNYRSDTGNYIKEYIDWIFVHSYVSPEPYASDLVFDSAEYDTIKVIVGGNTYAVLADGQQKSISYAPIVQKSLSIQNNQATVSIPGATVCYENNCYNESTTITPEQAIQNNMLVAYSNDPTNMFYVSVYVPVADYKLTLVSETPSLTSYNANFTLQLEKSLNVSDTDLAIKPVVYNITNTKLAPGQNIIKPSIDLSNVPYLVYLEPTERIINVTINDQYNLVDRIPITRYRSLTGSVIIKNTGNIVLDGLKLKVVIKKGNDIVFQNDYDIDPINPGETKSIILDYYGIPVPDVGVYSVALTIWYDPDGTTYTLASKEFTILTGYNMHVVLNKEAKITVYNMTANGEKIYEERGQTADFVVLPGQYKIVAEADDGSRAEKIVVVYANDVDVVLELSNIQSTSTISYLLLGVFVVLLLFVALILLGTRR